MRQAGLARRRDAAPAQKARWWIGTLNNPPAGFKFESLEALTRAEFGTGQLECGTAEGTPHVQFALWFRSQVRFAYLHTVLPRAHWEVMRGTPEELIRYVTKEDTRVEGPWTFGTRPVRHNNRTDWDAVRDLARVGNFEAIPAEVVVKHYTNLKTIAKDSIQPRNFSHTRGVWIFGAPGVGKTRFAREVVAGGNYYPKLLNKWWDGYRGEPYVVLDDPDADHAKWLPSHLKIWADAHGFIAEAKGSAVAPVYRLFIVTANYSIEELLAQHHDRVLVEAVLRRFVQYQMLDADTFKSPYSEPRVNRLFVQAALGHIENIVTAGMEDNKAVRLRHAHVFEAARQAVQERRLPPPVAQDPRELARVQRFIRNNRDFQRLYGPFSREEPFFEFLADENWQDLLAYTVDNEEVEEPENEIGVRVLQLLDDRSAQSQLSVVAVPVREGPQQYISMAQVYHNERNIEPVLGVDGYTSPREQTDGVRTGYIRFVDGEGEDFPEPDSVMSLSPPSELFD